MPRCAKTEYKEYVSIAHIKHVMRPEQRIESINYYFGEGATPDLEGRFVSLLRMNFYTLDELKQCNVFTKLFNSSNPEYVAFIPKEMYKDDHVLETLCNGKLDGIIKYIPKEVFGKDCFVEAILNYEFTSDVYDLLPNSLSVDPRIQKKFNRKGKLYNEDGLAYDGYDKEWLDKDGIVIRFFDLANGRKITKKEEYLKLVDEYIESKMSIPVFCHTFKISSVEGFRTLLKRIGKERLDKSEEIDETKMDAQQAFKHNLIYLAHKIVNGEITMAEYFEKYYRPTQNIDLFAKFSRANNIGREFAKIVIDYYLNFNGLYTKDMINFLNKPSEYGIRNIAIYFDGLRPSLIVPDDNAYQSKIHVIRKNIHYYQKQFNRKECYTTYIVGNERLVVTDDVIDQALAYITDNKLVNCYKSVRDVSKDIVMGKIVYDEETSLAKKKMQEEIIDLLNQKNTIEEYIEFIKNDKKSIILSLV